MKRSHLWSRARLPTYVITALLLALPSGVLLTQETGEKADGRLTFTSDSDEAKALLWQALHNGQNIFFLRAGELAQRAMELDPDFGLARVVYGFYAAGLTPAQRRAEMGRGIAAMGHASTGELLLATAMQSWRNQGAQEAKLVLHAAAKLFPNDPYVAFYAALATWGSGDYAGMDYLRTATEKFPKHAASYNILAYALWQAGDRDGGLNMVRKYVELVPDHPNSHDSHGEILQWAGRYDEALAAYGRVNELDPKFLGGFTGIADVSALRGDYGAARAALTAAIDHAPTKQSELNLRRAIGNTYLMEGNRRAATQQYQAVAAEAEANELSSLAALNYRMLAMTDALLGNGRSVASHIAKAGEAGGHDNPTQHAYAAWAHAEAGQLDVARDHASKVAETAKAQENWRTPAHVLSGLIHLQAKGMPAALDELRQADPDDWVVKALLARCYDAMGQKADARAMRDAVMSDHRMNVYNANIAVARMKVASIR